MGNWRSGAGWAGGERGVEEGVGCSVVVSPLYLSSLLYTPHRLRTERPERQGRKKDGADANM